MSVWRGKGVNIFSFHAGFEKIGPNNKLPPTVGKSCIPMVHLGFP